MDSAKKQASLFSFFQKTPKPKAGPNGDSPRSEQKHKKPEDEAKKPGEKAKKPEGLGAGGAGGREAGSLVWARLEGFPYWPAMVVPHPTLATVERRARGKAEVTTPPPPSSSPASSPSSSSPGARAVPRGAEPGLGGGHRGEGVGGGGGEGGWGGGGLEEGRG